MSDQNLSSNDYIIAACRNDQDDILIDLLKLKNHDINFADGAGNTAAHHAYVMLFYFVQQIERYNSISIFNIRNRAMFGSLACLEILAHQGSINMNKKNIATGDTPLHQAVQYTDEPDIALAMVDVLLQASADPRLKNKNDQTPIMLVDPKDEDMLDLLKQAIAGYEMVI
ncbi:hypothetical protein PHYBLDRAFT_67318 [Phycomyces blakesleeanus NRRL 1555(-)]|uniref:Uncharacterized protein n=1 Tax=Phycomyces blakesleeanus (strain ATCC 8743b / DSM 1359 / FGSC 10004 / NBRC 33097 / NRRL 1555) TaxID=763407 RepID=A0A162TAC2_PHYB8|nr:hypothetical protein PHYBLDRAFT_67318 [Phycomyces blakesleeanus NRRL 1555(-)]OAD67182.1 hypothetical protein PHYBLDRAFT_67318 [Phycomyces blakesleeanus NRRL 1555(-)]|eukprot:XP_018285222.1 hypothetical protein PHYBLDRAFT_67318 [Phycomyces blakesleeanus NRRL 1555(-)]